MKRQTIAMVVVVMILAGILFYSYSNEPSRKEHFNVSISAQYDKERVITGYYLDGQIFNTSRGYELISLPEGEIEIENINIKNQNFYEEKEKYNITKNTRIDIILSRPEKVEIKTNGKNPIIVELFSKNFKDVDFCLKGSNRFLFIKPEGNYSKIRKLEGFEDYEKCYDGNFSLKNSNYKINITYQDIGIIGEEDYIILAVIDKDGNDYIERIK